MTLGVAVVGLGFMGRTHVLGYRAADPVCRLVGVYDIDERRLLGEFAGGGNIDTGAAAGRLFDPGDVFVTDSLAALLARPDVDAVSICTPTDTHVAVATEALRAGKHVLIEKPVALDRASLAALAVEAERAGRICMPAMCIRFWPEWAWLARTLRDGSLGPLRSISLERVGAAPAWGNGFYQDEARCGGALYDLHIHDTDFVCFTLGMPESVCSVGDRSRVSTVYRFPDGPGHVVATGGWLRGGPAYRMRYLAEFDAATADYDVGLDPTLRLVRRGVGEPVRVEPGAGYEHEIRAFVAAVETGGPPPVTLADADRTLRVLEAEARSLATGRAERVEV